jgi:hypothetical protein
VKSKQRGRPFRKGYDPRRHILTKLERQKGYIIATQVCKMPSRIRCWLRWKLKHQMREKNARHYEEYTRGRLAEESERAG